MGWGPRGLGRERMGGTGTGNQRHCGPGTIRTRIAHQGRASPAPRLDTHSLPRPSKPALASNSPKVPVYHLPPTLPSHPPPQARVPRSLCLLGPKLGWGRGGAVLRVTGGGEPPTPPRPDGGDIQSWLNPKGPPSPRATRRSLRPALFSPASLSGVRARAGAGRGV